MSGKIILVTGSAGLIGSEVCRFFADEGWTVHGIDADMRATFFGPAGTTKPVRAQLESELPGYKHYDLDIRQRQGILDLIKDLRPRAIVHAAAQPSHDLAAQIPFDDFDTNAVGTLNLLEACRRFAAESPFVFMSTNKVYGDAPNELKLNELETRYDYAEKNDFGGIREDMRIDRSLHSLFGASKAAADLLVQEYGAYFGMPTACLRGGCLTGPNHAGVELHGFLSYLVKCNIFDIPYKVFGYKAKQVRDNIHSVDVARMISMFIESPRPGEVYNIGGGRDNSCSMLEAFAACKAITGKEMKYEYVDQARKGDHICYISDLSKIKSHYPRWSLTKSLDHIFKEIVERWQSAP